MMESRYVQQYRHKGILIDTNLLVLFFVGSYDLNLISTHKRTNGVFEAQDYLKLVRTINKFDKRVTLPHVLTEVSNLLAQIGEPIHSNLISKFGEGLGLFEEIYVPSANVDQKELQRFGLTDAIIAQITKGSYLFLTIDMRLGGYLANSGVDILEFKRGT
jgi:hypothetical protein